MSWSLSNKFKGAGTTAALTAGLSTVGYGLGSFLTDDGNTNKVHHYGKWGIAGGVDVATDLTATALATLAFGPVGGTIVGLGLMASGFMGVDPGSIALSAMDHMDETYDKMLNYQRGGFQLSNNSAQMLTRQIQNLQSSGSNIAEIMHN